MFQRRDCWCCVFYVVLGLAGVSIPGQTQAQSVPELSRGLVLLTEEQAKKLHLTEEEAQNLWLMSEEIGNLWQSGGIRKSITGSGPRIVFRNPGIVVQRDQIPLIETTVPFDLHIVFESAGAAEVDMNTLKIMAKKGFWPNIEYTKKLRPYVEGTTLQAESVKIPTGRFRIQIEIADQNQNKTILVSNWFIRD